MLKKGKKVKKNIVLLESILNKFHFLTIWISLEWNKELSTYTFFLFSDLLAIAFALHC
jgi:hypothetical protein